MQLHTLSVRRPVLTTVMSAMIFLLGLISIQNLGVREYPAIDPATVSVSTSWRGASAQVIERQITEPIEQALNGIDGIRTIVSQSREERSSITVEFELGIDLNQAANDVRDKVSKVQRSLPSDADPPSVSKADANSSPILILTLSGDSDLLALSEVATRVQDRLQTITGVAEARIWGEKRYAMRICLDPVKLSAHQLTIEDVRTALSAENADLPAGSLEGQNVSISLRSETGLRTVEEFRQVILRSKDNKTIHLGDVARVDLSAENERTGLKVNGKPMAGIAVVPQPGSNQVQIANQAKARIADLNRDLPEGYQLALAFDNTRFVRAALVEVSETLLIAFLLVVGVIFFFLRDWRSTLIPVATIPVSLVGVFSMLWLFGFSINVLTLLGIVLAVGIVVDDAIVVLENIYARIEEGLQPRAAAEKGLQEIFFAVVSTTLVLVAVFTPLLFLQGFTGRLFREFAVVIGGSVLISGFVALTLGGMLSSRLLRPHGQDNKLHHITEPFFAGMVSGYSRWLQAFLRHRWLPWTLVCIALGTAVLAWQNLPKELAPMEDRSSLQVQVTGHEGATYAYMSSYMERVSKVIEKTVPEASMILANTSSSVFGSANTGFFRIQLVPTKERKRSQQEIAQVLTRAIAQVEGARANVVQEQSIRAGGGRASQPLQLILQAPDLARLKEALPRFLDAAQASPILTTPEADLNFTKPQLEVRVDRNRLRDVGITPLQVSQALQLAFGGQRMGYFLRDGKQYQVLAEVDSMYRTDPSALARVTIRTSSGSFLPLGTLVEITEVAVPPQLIRYNRYAAATVSATPSPGHTLGEAIEEARNIAKQTLGPEFSTELGGTSRDFAESSSSLLSIFLAALLVVYLLLAAQFESWKYPLVILVTVPLALAGSLVTLWTLGHTMNLFSQIGLILLIGIVTKNGILIVEFANQRLAQGMSPTEAVVGAASSRLRPILMTTLATVLGILPVALALGAGAESRVPMGVAVIGGSLSSLALTLFVVPGIYRSVVTTYKR